MTNEQRLFIWRGYVSCYRFSDSKCSISGSERNISIQDPVGISASRTKSSSTSEATSAFQGHVFRLLPKWLHQVWHGLLFFYTRRSSQSVVRSIKQRTSLNRSHSPDTHKWCPLVRTVVHLLVFPIFWSRACLTTSSPKPASKWHTEMMIHLHFYMNLTLKLLAPTTVGARINP